MRRILGTGRYANVTATVALVVALGGTSYAAIKLPANSVTSKTVKDKSLLKKDFKAGQLPAGPAGPAGTNGTAATGFSASTPGALAFGAGVTVQSLSLPPGRYIIIAHAMAHNSDKTNEVNVKCTLNAGGEIDSLGSIGIDAAPAGTSAPAPLVDTSISMTGAATLASAGTAALVCTAAPATGSWSQRNLNAVQVGTLNG